MVKLAKKSGGGAIYFVAGIILIAAVLSITAGLLYLSFIQAPAACVGSTIAVAEILIDLSDPLPEVTKSQIEQQVMYKISTNNFEGALVEVRILNPSQPAGDVVFSACHPGNGDDVSEINADPTRAKLKWEQEFLKPFSSVLNNALSGSHSSPSSPILETLQAITVQQFLSKPGQKNLIVVSDMLQHSNVVSFYQHDVRNYFNIEAQAMWPQVKPILDNVNVEYFVLGRRSSKATTADLKYFWCVSWEAAAKKREPVIGENCPGWNDLIGLGK